MLYFIIIIIEYVSKLRTSNQRNNPQAQKDDVHKVLEEESREDRESVIRDK